MLRKNAQQTLIWNTIIQPRQLNNGWLLAQATAICVIGYTAALTAQSLRLQW
jgi:hypothetical protein